MLLLVYRSVVTVILFDADGRVPIAGGPRSRRILRQSRQLIGLTTFAVNLLVSLVIAAGTDYGIFFFGRYQEARQAGEDRETAFYTTYRGVAKVVLGSGLTIAGAVFCLSFTRLPYFQTAGRPLRFGYGRRGRGGAHAGSRGYCR